MVHIHGFTQSALTTGLTTYTFTNRPNAALQLVVSGTGFQSPLTAKANHCRHSVRPREIRTCNDYAWVARYYITVILELWNLYAP